MAARWARISSPCGSGPGRSGTLPGRPCREGSVATGATPTAYQLGQRSLPPRWPSAPAGGWEGRGEGVRAERRLNPGADDVEVDADESQRLAVDAAQRVGRLAPPNGAQYFRLDVFGRDALVAQDRAGRLGGRGRASRRCSQPM
jgi:hypothetical protein